ncbi:tRNA-specific adenosine-34 deaminase [Candidatus Omnitrophus magneticus]|uniref:tRNA-specific adenosine deaminase n=1 Tax=Candidatus Omnitrophus magneticus TaxID=1609969 RepID=A0A0F0CVI8_9BACT|nr:tRNA-specific adenosine-34 deaminase [Candidatus Omnitrophus magneticus]
MDNEFYMREALKEAYKAFDEEEVPVGAVLVHDGIVIGRAHNQIKTLKDPTAHAEILAITQGAAYLNNERLTGAVLYVTIEPCVMCVGAVILARLDAIVFGAREPKTGACGSLIDLVKPGLFNHSLKITGSVLELECKTILQKFFLARR